MANGKVQPPTMSRKAPQPKRRSPRPPLNPLRQCTVRESARAILTKDGEPVSLGHLYRETGVSIAALSRIFSGERTPTLRTARLIAAYLGVDLDTFYAHVCPAPNQLRRKA